MPDAATTDPPVTTTGKPAKAKPAEPTPEELAAYDAESVRLIGEANDAARSHEAIYNQYSAEAKDAKKRYEQKVDALRELIRQREEKRGKRPEPTLLDVVPAWRSRPADAVFDDPAASFLDAEAKLRIRGAVQDLGDLHDQLARVVQDGSVPFGLTFDQAVDLRNAVQAIIDAETPAAIEPPAELWREYPIERWMTFGLTAKDVEKLASGESKDGRGHPILTVGDLNRYVTPNPVGAPDFTRGYADIKGIGRGGADRISEAETKFWAYWRDGGESEFAAERGITNGAQAEPGPGSGDAEAAGRGPEPGGEPATSAGAEPDLIPIEVPGVIYGDNSEPAPERRPRKAKAK